MGLPFLPAKSEAAYFTWPMLPELFPVSYPGIQPSRDEVVVDIDRGRLIKQMQEYFDASISHEEMSTLAPMALKDTNRFKARATREYLQKRGFLPKNIVRYCYRPFDYRWLYWEPETKLLDEKRSDYFPQIFAGNLSLGSAQANRRDYDPPIASSIHCSRHVIERGANLFPIKLRAGKQQSLIPHSEGKRNSEDENEQFNLSESAHTYLKTIGKPATPKMLFLHAMTILHSSQFRIENAGALLRDWPRVPIPKSKVVLGQSADLGQLLADLLNPEAAVEGVTSGRSGQN